MKKEICNKIRIFMFLISVSIVSESAAADLYSVFEQSDWRGGVSTQNASDPVNKTGWTKYSSKTSNIDTTQAGGSRMSALSFSLTDDADLDFKGTLNNVQITGAGALAKLGISTVYQDPFSSALGEWANLPFAPYMGRTSPLVRAGNYIYSLWQGYEANKTLARWSIADEKWEIMADIPMSTGQGAALAYDGADILYVLVGGNRKEFYAYQISTNTWYQKANVPSNVGQGGAIVVVASLNKAFVFCGNGTSVFYRYTVPVSITQSGSWSAVESAPFSVSVGASLVYPIAASPFIYASAGGGSTSFAKFDYTAASNAWTSLATCPGGLSWDSDVVYPGAGNYLYAWNGGSRWFGRYFIGSDTWESSSYPATPPKNIELPALPFYISSRMYLYDSDNTGTELRLLSNHSYNSTYRFYPATKKWREESATRNNDSHWGQSAVYVAAENAIYWIPGNGYKQFYKYYLTFNSVSSSNTAVVFQWERLTDMSFAGNTSGEYLGGGLAYNQGDNYIYCLQGYNFDGFSRFNLTTKAWEQLAPIPQKVYYGGSLVAAGNYIYATGGQNANNSGQYTNNLYRYDPATNTWTTISNNIYGSFYAGACLVYPDLSDYIYVLRSNSRSEFMRYQISTGLWERRANLPDMFVGYQGKLVYSSGENAIYFINGHDWDLYAKGFCKYNISTNTWQVLDYPAFQHLTAAACASAAKLYYIGRDTSGVQTYDFTSGQWNNSVVNASYSPGKYFYGNVVVKDDYAYMFYNARSSYAWKYSISQKKWLELIKLPFFTQGYGHKAVYPGSGDYIYVSQGEMTKNFWKYNTVTGAWTQLNSSPFMFTYGARMVADASGIYVCPGNYNSTTFLKFTDDVSGGSWITLTSMLEPVYYEGNGTCIISSGLYKGIYMLKQYDSVKFTKFNLDNETWGYLSDVPWAISSYAYLFYPGTGNFIYCLKGSGRDFAKYDLTQDVWTILTEASISVNGNPGGFYLASSPDVIYFYLGTGHGSLGVNFNRYSISQNRWDEPIVFPESNTYGSQICPMPSGEDLFYLRGGGGSNVYKYNISTSVWFNLQPTPASIGWDAKAIYPGSGDYIYVTRGEGTYDLWKYGVSTDMWTNLAAPPATFSTGQAIAYKDNYIYVLRGGSTNTFWRYSVENNDWKEMAVTPAVCTRGANLVYPGTGDYLYAAAGGGSTAIWRYSVISNSWSTLTPLPVPNVGGVLFCPGFGDYLYFFVSYNYDASYGSPYFYRYSITGNIWEIRPSLPFCLNGQSSAIYPGTGDYIYLASGYGLSSLMKNLLFSSGEYTSEIKEIGNNTGFGNINWQDNGWGQIDVKVRTGNNSSLSDAKSWGYAGKVSKNLDLTNCSSVKDKDKYLQYRLRFFAYDLAQPPQLDNLSFNYNKYPLQEELISSAYNTDSLNNRLKTISWMPTLPTGTDIRFQVRTAPNSGGVPGSWTPWLGPAGIQQIPYEFTSEQEYAKSSEIAMTNGTAKLSKILADYLYRQRIVIDNTFGAQAYTNTTIKVDISETNIDFWTHVADNGFDIRFADSDGKTPLKYRVVGFSKTKKSASCWITIPFIPQGTTKDIYLLYGKADAISESDASLAESMIGTDFYGFMFAFFDIVTTDAPNRIYIDKLDSAGQIVASTFLDFTSIGQKKRYDDTDLTVYHVYSKPAEGGKPFTLFSSSMECTSNYDDDWYFASGNDLWLWCPSNNYDGDVIISAYNDDTQIKITDYGKGDDTTTITLDKGNFWFGWNRVDERGEVWHIEATKPITVMAGLIAQYYEASEQVRSPDLKEYYFYAPDTYLTVTAYEDNTSFIIDNLDSVTGDYSGMLNKGQSYKHIPNPPTGSLTMRTYLWADKPVCVTSNDRSDGGATIYQSADTLTSVGKEYYINSGESRYLRVVNLEEGANNIDITGDINPSPTTVNLSTKGGSAFIDLQATYRNLQLKSTKKFAVYVYSSSWGEAITPVFKPTEFNHLIPTSLIAQESAASSVNPALSGWLYKESIKIDNTLNDTGLTAFQISVDVDKNHKDFWLHSLPDGADVRFLDEDDNTLLSYYTEYFIPSEKKARFWIKIPSIPNTQQKSVYMYYGKIGATSQSDGSQVFEFFDDFNTNLNQWDTAYCNLTTISSILGMDSVAFNLPTGTNTVTADVVIPSAIVPERIYDWYWELRWSNGALVEAQSIAQPFTLRYDLLSMEDGPFMIKKVDPGQIINTLGGTFTNTNVSDYTNMKYRFTLTDASTAAVFSNIDSATFTIPKGTNTISNVSITMPVGLLTGHLYYWSWILLDGNNNTVFSSSSAPAPLFNISVGFQLDANPILPIAPFTGGSTRQVSGTFSNTSGLVLNNLIWRFTLIDTTQGGRSVVKVAHNGYLQAKVNLSPDYNLSTQVIWQTANKTGRHFLGISDPNAKFSIGIGNANYKAGYDVLINSNGYLYDESGNGFNTWNSQRVVYTATMWNTEKITWWPHDPSNNKVGKLIYELSSGDKLTYNAGFVAGPGLAIKPTVRSSSDAIYIDKFLVYKNAKVKPYVGFVFTEVANPMGMDVYYTTNPVIQPVLGVFYNNNLTAFQDIVITPVNTDVKYQISSDGYNWYWWNGLNWAKVTGGFSQTNNALVINSNLAGFVSQFGSGEFFYRAFLNSSDGINTPSLDKVTVTTTGDPTFYVTSAGSLINYLNSDTSGDQWFQYKAIFNSHGQETPVLQDVKLEYLSAYLKVNVPNGGESWPIGQTKTITWASQGIDEANSKVKIEYSADNGNTWILIADNQPNTGAYDWQVANNPSPIGLIRITSKEFPVLYDTSDSAFGIMGLILNSPNSGEKWEIGSSHNITWSTFGSVSNNLKIEYSKDSGTSWILIADQQLNDGIYTWNISTNTSNISDTCLVRIIDANNTNLIDTSNGVFSIVPIPSITLNSPNGMETWKAGSTKIIDWTNNGNVNSQVDVYYSVNSGVSWIILQSAVNNSGSYSCVVPDLLTDKARIRVIESQVPAGRDTQSKVEDSSNVDFTIMPPTITVTSPNGGEKWVKGDTYSITWTSDGVISNALSIEYSKDNGNTWFLISGNEANDGVYSWIVPQEAVGINVTIKITDSLRQIVTDTSNNYFEVLDQSMVVLVNPNGGESTTIGAPYEIKWFTIGKVLDTKLFDIYFSANSGATWSLVADQQLNDGSYIWLPPDLEITTAKIKIICNDVTYSSIFDISDNDFIIQKPQMTLITPNGAEIWYATGYYNITWQTVGAIGLNAIKLEYSANGGATWNLIIQGIANTGTYNWQVADNITSQLKVKVSDATQPGVEDQSDAVSSIISPAITVTSPNGGELWVVGLDYSITWISEGSNGSIRNNLNLQYSPDNGNVWKNIILGKSNDGSYIWTIPNDISNNCLVKVFDSTRPATKDNSNLLFKIIAPSLTIVSPNGGESWPYGTQRDITWNTVGQVSDDVSISYSKDGGSSWVPIFSGVTSGHKYTWTIPSDISSTCKVKVKDNNPPGIEDTTDAVFSISYPVITITRPNGGEIFAVTDNENIIWTTSGAVSNSLKIVYSNDNFILDNNLIADNVPNTGMYVWIIPDRVSTNLRVKVTDNATPQITDKSNSDFSILPFPIITIDSPNGGETWRIGTAHSITWHDNGGPLSNNLKLEYSTDGGSSWKQMNFGIANTGSYEWTVPDDYSLNSKIKITDLSRTTTTDDSNLVFSIDLPLITIASPVTSTFWAIGDQAPVSWTSEGTVSNNLLLQYSTDNFVTVNNISVGEANDGAYTWTVPNEPTVNMKLRIVDGDRPATLSVSGPFTILSNPQITLTAPNGGEEYVIGDTLNVTWISKGLDIKPLTLAYSSDNFATSKNIVSGLANNGSYSWTIPNDAMAVSTLRVKIYDPVRPVITDSSDNNFRIRGGFAFISPNSTSEWAVSENKNIAWTTKGQIPNVRLEYTLDNGVSWTSITSSTVNNDSYSWKVPDFKGQTAKIRISNVADSTVNTVSDAFKIIYYKINWRVLDYDNMNNLQNLSVRDGWWVDNTGTIIAPVDHEYPYGNYTTFWSKEGYIERSTDWVADSHKTVSILLENQISAQIEWHVLLSTAYSAETDTINANCWLERRGKLVGPNPIEKADLTQAEFSVYDGATLVKSFVSTSPSDQGIFFFSWEKTGLEAGKTYFVKAVITFRNGVYTSGSSIDLTASKKQYEEKQQLDIVSSKTDQLNLKLDETKSSIEDKVDSAKSSIETKVSEVKSETSKILTAAETTIPAQITQTKEKVEVFMKSEILNRESTVRSGQSLMIRYRSYPGLKPSIDVYNAKNLQVINKAPMSSSSDESGIYEYEVKFPATWGKGDFTIVCSESSKGSLDAMIISVIRSDIDEISGQVAAVLGSTSGISDLSKTTGLLNSQFNIIESVIERISRDMASQVKDKTSNNFNIESLFAQLNTLSGQIKNMGGTESVNLDKLYEVSKDKKDDINYLKNKTQELKAVMEINRKIMESSSKKPVVQSWFEYK